ncbi:MAG: hypothetical protein ACLFVJ_18865 [Persicimonas sp.]
MDNLALEYCRLIDATHLVELLDLPKARERRKWACPACGSSDALHVYPGPGRGSTCFSCDAHPDAIDLVELVIGTDFMGAVRWLAGEFGFTDLVDGTADPREARERHKKIKAQVERRRKEKARMEAKARKRARSVYNKLWPMLELGPAGREYLEARGIPVHVAGHVGIRSVESMDQWRDIRSGFWPGTLAQAGLEGANDGDTYPVPWRAPFLVIPYWLEEGGIDVIRFRDLSGKSNAKYLSPLGQRPTTPYLSHAAYDIADDYPTLYVCEGELNALSVLWAGAPAVSSCGNGVWRPEWSRPFRWYGQVVVLCDGDDAGRAFSVRVRDGTAEVLGRDWTQRKLKRRIFIPGTDANDALVDGRLEELVRAA